MAIKKNMGPKIAVNKEGAKMHHLIRNKELSFALLTETMILNQSDNDVTRSFLTFLIV